MTRWITLSLLATLLAFPQRANATLHAGRQVIAGFHTDDDGYEHAIILLSNGDIREIYYESGVFHSGSVLWNIPDAIAIAGFYSNYDQVRHVIVARSSGEVDEIYYGSWGLSVDTLAYFPANSITGVAGWANNLNHYHAAVSLTSGYIDDLEYGPLVSNPQWISLYSFGGAVTIEDIAGWGHSNSNRIVAQVTSPNNAMAVLSWDDGSPNPTAGYVTQSTFPTGCNMNVATNVSGAQFTSTQDQLFWGTGASSDSVCYSFFTSPVTGTQSDPAYDYLTALTGVRSSSGFRGAGLAPHVATAYTTSLIYDVYQGGHYYLGSY